MWPLGSPAGASLQAAKRHGLTLEGWHDLKVEIMEAAWEATSYTAVAHRYGVSDQLVARVAKRGPEYYKAKDARTLHELTPEEKRRRWSVASERRQAKNHGMAPHQWRRFKASIIRRIQSGEPFAALSQRYGVSRRSMERWLASSDPVEIETAIQAERRDIVDRYFAGEKAKDLAFEVGMTPRTIFAWAAKARETQCSTRTQTAR